MVVTGKPGAGKTTFVKRVCHQWAELTLQKCSKADPAEKGIEILQQFSFLIPIILRLVKQKQTMLDIIKDQFCHLSNLDIHCISMAIETYPKDVLLIFDGFDELSASQNCVHHITSKQKHTEITLVITTRPHGVTLINQLGSMAIDQMAQLCGFSNKQIKRYIYLYFKKKVDLANKLNKCLFRERPDLHKMAQIPIHLQMICIVWKVYKNLGSNMVDLYDKFILCLLDHLEKKYQTAGMALGGKQLLIKRELLSRIGLLANQWNKMQLKTTFGYDRVDNICAPYTSQIVEMGCITKYHPSNELSTSYWSFTHLTIQEYFVAYFLSTTENTKNLKDFELSCSNMSRLERNAVVIKFLIGLDAGRANSILNNIIKRTKLKSDCKRLIEVLLDIIPEYQKPSDYDLWIPSFIEVDSKVKRHTKELTLMLLEAKDGNFANVCEVSTCNIANSIYEKCHQYIRILTLKISSFENIDDMVNMFGNLRKLVTLNIDIDTKQTSQGHETDRSLLQLLMKANLKSLSCLHIQGAGTIQQVVTFLPHAPSIRKLSLSSKVTTQGDDIQSLCRAIENQSSIAEVELYLDDLHDALLLVSDKVALMVSIQNPTSGALENFVTILSQNKTTCGLSGINFGIGNFQSHGKQIRKLIFLLPHLKSLDLSECCLTAETIENMKDANDENNQSDMNTLLLARNHLEGGGADLGELLQSMPNLTTLDLCICKLGEKDWTSLTQSFTRCTTLANIRLRSNAIRKFTLII